MKSKILNSKAYQVFDYICRLVILNLLLIIVSFSIFLLIINIFPNLKDGYQILCLIPTALNFLPSIVAVAEVIKGYEIEKNTGIFKEFFTSFKKHFKNSSILSVILILCILLISNSISYFSQMQTEGVIYTIGFGLSLSLVLIMIIGIIHLPLVMIYFDGLNILHYVKLSLIFAFKDLGLTLLGALFVIISIVLCYLIGIYFILIAFSLTIYLLIKITKNKYIKISERNK
jgi:uncharacterized membrane protein YesL